MLLITVWLILGYAGTRLFVKFAKIGVLPFPIGLMLTVGGPVSVFLAVMVAIAYVTCWDRVSKVLFGKGE